MAKTEYYSMLIQLFPALQVGDYCSYEDGMRILKKDKKAIRQLLLLNLVHAPPEKRLWVRFNNGFTLIGIGKDPPEEWVGFIPK